MIALVVVGGLIGSSLIGIFSTEGPQIAGVNFLSFIGFVALGRARAVAALGRPPLRTAVGPLSHALPLVRSSGVRTVPALSDREAVRRLRRDPKAITVIYERHVARLIAALAGASGDREVAFDVAQETFARLLERGHRIRLTDDGSAWPWLWTVARNLLRDWKRRDVVDASARRRLRIPVAPYSEQAIDELIARVDAEALQEPLGLALQSLPPEQLEAVMGRVVLGHEYPSLAASSGVSEQALRARVSRGLRTLRIRLSGGKP